MLYLLIIVAFAVLVFNFFTRKKFMRYLHQLQEQRIQIQLSDIFNKEKRLKELHPKHPASVELIESFSKFARQSMLTIAFVFGGFILIAIFIQLFA